MGSKCAAYSKNNIPYAVDITDCGWNAINCIFEFLEQNGNSVQVLLQHADFTDCKSYEFMVDGQKHCKDIWDLNCEFHEFEKRNRLAD
jgi:hypothetical protein